MSKRGRPPGRTDKGEATFEKLFAAAIARFEADGFDATTVRAIARDAEVSPGLMYRHFPSKQSVVLELYRRASARFVEDCRSIESGSWQERALHCVGVSRDTLAPYRGTLRAVLGQLLVGDGGLLGPKSASTRGQVAEVFVSAATGADNAPPSAAALGRLLYLGQLGFLLFWLLDRTPDQQASDALLGVLRSTARPLGWAVRLLGSTHLVEKLDDLVDAALYRPSLQG